MNIFAKILISGVVFASTSHAMDLSGATNSELLNEVSRRLGTSSSPGGGDGSLLASCSSGYIKLSVYGTTANDTMSDFIGSTCETVVNGLQPKVGSFSGIRILSICKSGYLQTIKAESIGKITVANSDFVGSNCQAQADRNNAQK